MTKKGYNPPPSEGIKRPRTVPSAPPPSKTIPKMDITIHSNNLTTQKSYRISVECGNCGYPRLDSIWEIAIPFGNTISEYLKEFDCPYCGCKTVRRT